MKKDLKKFTLDKDIHPDNILKYHYGDELLGSCLLSRVTQDDFNSRSITEVLLHRKITSSREANV